MLISIFWVQWRSARAIFSFDPGSIWCPRLGCVL